MSLWIGTFKTIIIFGTALNIWNGIDCKDRNLIHFFVAKDGKPWILVEVKTSDTKLSSARATDQKATGARHAFQVVFNPPYENVDCSQYTDPTILPAQTFLSQLP